MRIAFKLVSRNIELPMHLPSRDRSTRGAEASKEGLGPRLVRRGRIRLLRGIVNALFRISTTRLVKGIENVPQAGPCILVFNHISNFDPPLIFSLITRYDMTALVAAEYKSNFFYRRAIEWAGGTWIRRGSSDRAALKSALDALERGWIVGISPEGGRSKTGRMREGKPGPSFLAFHAGVPVLPVGLTGTGAIADGLKRLRRVPLTVTFGTVFALPPNAPGNQKHYFEECSNEIMCRIAALVPPDYRGVHSSSPRLQELLDARSNCTNEAAVASREEGVDDATSGQA